MKKITELFEQMEIGRETSLGYDDSVIKETIELIKEKWF